MAAFRVQSCTAILAALLVLSGRMGLAVFDDQVRVFFFHHISPIESIGKYKSFFFPLFKSWSTWGCS
jgi:hypothetical protein